MIPTKKAHLVNNYLGAAVGLTIAVAGIALLFYMGKKSSKVEIKRILVLLLVVVGLIYGTVKIFFIQASHDPSRAERPPGK